MSPQVTPTLYVEGGAAPEIEFHLTIGGAQEKVTVSDAAQLVDTKSTAVSTLLDERAIADLPLNGRRFSDLMLLSPGVTQRSARGHFGPNQRVAITINGLTVKAATFVQTSAVAGLAPYPGYYQLPQKLLEA